MKKYKKNLKEIAQSKTQCPVCHQYHFSCVNSYEICPICGWEDDLVQKKDPSFSGGANKLSLNEYRKKYYEKENV